MKEKVRHGGLGGWRDKASPSYCPSVTDKLAPGLEGPLQLILGSGLDRSQSLFYFVLQEYHSQAGAYSNGDFDGI